MGSVALPAPQSVDLISDSLGGLLAVAFPRSRSLRYPLAVELAKTASKYFESQVGGVPYHLAAFGRTQEQAARAVAITHALRGQKGAEFFAGGAQLDETSRLLKVLSCYLQSCACTDPRAHCNRVIAQPFTDSGAEASISRYQIGGDVGYVWPCAFMLQWNTPKLQTNHPSTPEDQLQARAVAIGCANCPNFKPTLAAV